MSEVNVSPSVHSNNLPADDNKEDETEEVKVVATGSIVQVKDQTSGQVMEAVVINQEELNKLKDEDNLNIDNNARNFQSAQVIGNTSGEKIPKKETAQSDNAVAKRKQSSLEKVFSSVSRKLSKASATLSNKSRSSKKSQGKKEDGKNKDEYTYEYTYAEIEEGKAPEDGRRKSEEKPAAEEENKEAAAPSRKTTPVVKTTPEVKQPSVVAKPPVKAPAAKPVAKAPVTKAPVAKPVAAPKTNSPPPQEGPATKKRKDSFFKRFLVKIKVWRRKKKPSQSN